MEQKATKQTDTFSARLSANLLASPFPLKQIGAMRLKRSNIPQEQCDRLGLHIDKDTHLMLSTQALKKGFTTDEYIRQILWTAVTI